MTPITPELRDRLRQWARLAPDECLLMADWSNTMIIGIGTAALYLETFLDERDRDLIFSALLNAIESRSDIEFSLMFVNRTWVCKFCATNSVSDFVRARESDRLVALLSGYVQAIEILQGVKA